MATSKALEFEIESGTAWTCAHNDLNKKVLLDADMIALRNKLAAGLGYVIRPCSLGNQRPCMEKVELTSEFHGHPCSPYHATIGVAQGGLSPHVERGEYHYPDEVLIAAHALDKSKRKAVSK